MTVLQHLSAADVSPEMAALYRDIRKLYPDTVFQGELLVVPTHCLYPSGEYVTLTVRPLGGAQWVVADNGRGWDNLIDSMMEPSAQAAAHKAKPIEKRTGVSFKTTDHSWHLDITTADQMSSAIAWVAHASQAWVTQMILGASEPAVHAILEARLQKSLIDVFGERQVEAGGRLQGGSSKAHSFSAIVHFKDARYAVFEAVTPHTTSINAAFTKLRDVAERPDKPLALEAVVENLTDWASSDIALLRSAATSVVDTTQLGAHLHTIAA